MINGKEVRVYIAGPLSGETLDYLRWAKRMIQVATRLFERGFDPFCPALDMQFILCSPKLAIPSRERFYSYSVSFLRACHCMLLLPEWENSQGVKKELPLAVELNMPVFMNEGELLAYYGVKEGA